MMTTMSTFAGRRKAFEISRLEVNEQLGRWTIGISAYGVIRVG